MKAPAIIHQIWFQGWENRPAKHEENVQQLREMNPEFVFYTWDDAMLRAECRRLGPEYLARYDSFPLMINKIDFGRYVVLYNYGGMSMDLDMKPLRPISETPALDKHDFIISYSAFPFTAVGMVNNALFIVTPQHPIMKEILDDIVGFDKTENDYLTKEMYIHNSTGPYKINKILDKYKSNVHFMDNQYFEPCISVDPYCTVTAASIADHKHEMSWMNPVVRKLFGILFYILHNWYVVLGVIMVVVAWLVFGKKLTAALRPVGRYS